MPVSVATARDPFRGRAIRGEAPPEVTVPQARVLRALMPRAAGARPAFSRTTLVARAGFTPKSGVINQALHGVRRVTKDRPKLLPGLLGMGMVELVKIDVEGSVESSYQITDVGEAAYHAHVAARGELPPIKDAATSTNDRYRRGGEDADGEE